MRLYDAARQDRRTGIPTIRCDGHHLSARRRFGPVAGFTPAGSGSQAPIKTEHAWQRVSAVRWHHRAGTPTMGLSLMRCYDIDCMYDVASRSGRSRAWRTHQPPPCASTQNSKTRHCKYSNRWGSTSPAQPTSSLKLSSEKKACHSTSARAMVWKRREPNN